MKNSNKTAYQAIYRQTFAWNKHRITTVTNFAGLALSAVRIHEWKLTMLTKCLEFLEGVTQFTTQYTEIETERMSDNAKRKVTKIPAEHPKYEEMIKTAIRTLKDRNGSSRQAIDKYIKANYTVGDTASRHIKTALKKGTSNGTFLNTKGVGASGSFKLPKEQKKPAKKPAAPSKKPLAKPKKPAATKKDSPKKSAAKKETSSKKKSSTKSPSSKKDTSKKTAVKKPSVTHSATKPKVAAKKPNTKKEVKKPAAVKKAKATKKK